MPSRRNELRTLNPMPTGVVSPSSHLERTDRDDGRPATTRRFDRDHCPVSGDTLYRGDDQHHLVIGVGGEEPVRADCTCLPPSIFTTSTAIGQV